MSPSRLRPSPAFVISVLALFVALGGVGYAAATVGTNDIQTGAVTSPKIHNEAIKPWKLASGAVTNGAIATGAVNARTMAADSVGGSQLAPFSVGASELKVIQATSNARSIAAGTSGTATVMCPSSAPRAISGGFITTNDPDQDLVIRDSQRIGGPTGGWSVTAHHGTAGVGDTATLTADVYCLEQ